MNRSMICIWARNNLFALLGLINYSMFSGGFGGVYIWFMAEPPYHGLSFCGRWKIQLHNFITSLHWGIFYSLHIIIHNSDGQFFSCPRVLESRQTQQFVFRANLNEAMGRLSAELPLPLLFKDLWVTSCSALGVHRFPFATDFVEIKWLQINPKCETIPQDPRERMNDLWMLDDLSARKCYLISRTLSFVTLIRTTCTFTFLVSEAKNKWNGKNRKEKFKTQLLWGTLNLRMKWNRTKFHGRVTWILIVLGKIPHLWVNWRPPQMETLVKSTGSSGICNAKGCRRKRNEAVGNLWLLYLIFRIFPRNRRDRSDTQYPKLFTKAEKDLCNWRHEVPLRSRGHRKFLAMQNNNEGVETAWDKSLMRNTRNGGKQNEHCVKLLMWHILLSGRKGLNGPRGCSMCPILRGEMRNPRKSEQWISININCIRN